MKKIPSSFLIILLLTATAAFATIKPAAITPDANKILYVDKHVSGGDGSGNSWANAVTELADALVAANTLNTATAGSVQQVWVAVGTYMPTALPPYSQLSPTDLVLTDRDKTFYIPSGVKLYGGFDPANGITLLTHQRILPGIGGVSSDLGTILSGDLGTLNNSSDNCYHVVLASATSSLVEGVTIDGFTITGGRSSEDNGIIRVNTNWVYRNRGGGVFINYGLNTLKNNAISSNYGTSGGGLRTEYGSYTISGNLFLNNSGTNGGGILMNNGGSIDVSRNVFAGNSATVGGGAINSGTTNSAITNFYTNNVFTSNSAAYGGGVCVTGGAHKLVNNTFFGNSASSGGGAYADYIAASSTAARGFYNNIFWNNKKGGSATVAGSDYYRIYNSTVTTFKNNLLQLPGSSYTGDNFSLNSSTDNLFETDPTFKAIANPAGTDGLWGTTDDGLQLQATSAALNVGIADTTGLHLPTTDLAGNARIQLGRVDMGAYEGSPSVPTIDGLTADPYPVCLGASIIFTATIGNVTGSYTYTLTNGSSTTSGTSSDLAFNQSITATIAGLQTFILTVSSNGQSTSATYRLAVSAPPILTLTASNDGLLTCTQTSLTLTASADEVSDYQFSGPGIQDEGFGWISVDTQGVYSVTATIGETGCFSTTTTTVTSNTALTVSASASSTLVNAGTTISLTASGATSYQWTAPPLANFTSPAASSTVSAQLTNTGVQTFTVVGTTGICNQTQFVSVTITNGPDLTATIRLPDSNFPVGGSKNFIMELTEVNGQPTTSGSVVITITAPMGYTVSFDNSLGNIAVSGGSITPVSNAQWTITPSLDSQQLSLQMNPKQFVAANGQAIVGFTMNRTSANSGSVANITVNISDDPSKTYDTNSLNNVYVRIIAGL